MKDRGFRSMEALGKAVGVTGEMIRQYKGGAVPGGDKLPALARALAVSQDELLKRIQGELVERDGIPDQAAVVIWNDETNEVWITIELSGRVVVHNPIHLRGGKSPTRGREAGKAGFV